MSIRSSINEARSAISDNRPSDALSALDSATGGLGAIKTAASSARGNNITILDEAQSAQRDMKSALESAQTTFQTSVDEAKENLAQALNAAQENFARTLAAAQSTFATAVSAAEQQLAWHVNRISSEKSENDKLLGRIDDLAS